MVTSEYNNHGEWSLTLVQSLAREAGEYTVTAENSLGSSTRDWRLRVRQPRPQPLVTARPSEVREGSPSCHIIGKVSIFSRCPTLSPVLCDLSISFPPRSSLRQIQAKLSK